MNLNASGVVGPCIFRPIPKFLIRYYLKLPKHGNILVYLGQFVIRYFSQSRTCTKSKVNDAIGLRSQFFCILWRVLWNRKITRSRWERDVTFIERDPEPELERTVLVVQLAPPPVYYFILNCNCTNTCIETR